MEIKDFEDIDYVALAEVKEYYIDFIVYKGDQYYQDEDYLFKGTVKKDGCSNWDFTNPIQMHFCTQQEAKNLGIILERLYNWAAELMPDHSILDK